MIGTSWPKRGIRAVADDEIAILPRRRGWTKTETQAGMSSGRVVEMTNSSRGVLADEFERDVVEVRAAFVVFHLDL